MQQHPHTYGLISMGWLFALSGYPWWKVVCGWFVLRPSNFPGMVPGLGVDSEAALGVPELGQWQ